MVAKGPDSLGVIRLFGSLGARRCAATTTSIASKWWDAKRAGEELPKLKPAHQRVADELEDEDWEWLAALPLWLELPEHDALVVHAGLLPDLPLEEQDPDDLMNMRSILADGTPSRSYEEGTPWAESGPDPGWWCLGTTRCAVFRTGRIRSASIRAACTAAG